MGTVATDEAAFRRHLAEGSYLLGASSGRWRLASITWPHAVFSIRARDGAEYGLRFEASNYPRTAPAARPWDIDANAPLPAEQWPKGKVRIPLAFNPSWKNGCALYLPCDRVSIEGHANWNHEHPSLIWNPALGIVHYLRVVHDLLNSGDYIGAKV